VKSSDSARTATRSPESQSTGALSLAPRTPESLRTPATPYFHAPVRSSAEAESRQKVPAILSPPLRPSVTAPVPRTPADVLALQAAYGNAAVSLVTSEGALAIQSTSTATRSAGLPEQVPTASRASSDLSVGLGDGGTAAARPLTIGPDPTASSPKSPGEPQKGPAGSLPVAPTEASTVAALSGADSGKGAQAQVAVLTGVHRDQTLEERATGIKIWGGAGKPTGAGAHALTQHRVVSPGQNAAFEEVVDRARAIGKQQVVRGAASANAGEAHAATISRANEVPIRAAVRRTAELDRQQRKPFDRAAFRTVLRSKVEETALRTFGQAGEFKDRRRLNDVKSVFASRDTLQKRELLKNAPASKPDGKYHVKAAARLGSACALPLQLPQPMPT
jgi:hypothetical protein